MISLTLDETTLGDSLKTIALLFIFLMLIHKTQKLKREREIVKGGEEGDREL